MYDSKYVYKLNMLICLLIESYCYIAKKKISNSRYMGLEFCAVGKYIFKRVHKIVKTDY